MPVTEMLALEIIDVLLDKAYSFVHSKLQFWIYEN